MGQIKRLLLVVVLIVLAACQADRAVAPEATVPGNPSSTRPEVRTGYMRDTQDRAIKITFEVIDGLAIREGDIIIGHADSIPATAEELARRSGARFAWVANETSSNRWPDGVVKYIISVNLPNPWRVRNAAAHIQAYAPGIRLVEISEAETVNADFIRVVWGASACWSSMGRQVGPQAMYVADGCTTRDVIHEFGHALGLQHEHMRCDRDDHVEVLWSNIKSAHHDQYITGQCPSALYSAAGSYDQGSIMHYRGHEFAVNTALPTLRAHNGRPMGSTETLSSLDVSALSWMYGARLQIHRSYHPHVVPGGDHLYSVDINEVSHNGYTLEAADYFRLTSATGPHYAPLYRCYINGRHYLSRSASCEVGRAAEGSLGRVSTWQMIGTVPLYRLRDPRYGDRLATTSLSERNATLSAGWVDEGILGFVWQRS